MTDAATYDRTRTSLHIVSESLLAGPQHRRSGTIRLSARPDGFRTLDIDDDVRSIGVHGSDLVVTRAEGALVVPLGGTLGDLAERTSIDVGPPVGVYHLLLPSDPATPIEVDPDAAQIVQESLAAGDAALRRLVPDEEPVLWCEHFDVGIQAQECNLGVSPGDHFLAVPYAYVGPWKRRAGDFWDQPFGSARPLSELDGDDGIVEYLREGLRRAAEDPLA